MRCIGLFIAASVFAASYPALAQELPSQKVLTLDVARTMTDAALKKCRADGYKVTVTVLDSGNILKAYVHDDGASFGTIEIGRMKAYTTIAFGRASGPPANLAAGAPVPAPILPGTTNLVGALPIKVGDQLIGAISVSGAPGGEKDAACAAAGLDAVVSLLK